MMYRLVAVVLMAMAGLSGCASRPVDWDPDDYTVKSGDTLYSIAWRYELDAEDLAAWNQLTSPYTIHPGERLHTRAPRSTPDYSEQEVVESASTDGQFITVKPGDTLYTLARNNGLPTWKLATINGIEYPYILHPGQKLRLSGAASASSKTAQNTSGGVRRVQADSGPLTWSWPLRGKVISKFVSWKNDAKGVDIAGQSGDEVRAAAAGKVVYSGNSLINYGHLVIIKHSSEYLSAYANNQQLLVKEGEQVTPGQVIARLGSTDSKKPYVHFEIRKKGKPVDPLHYLPIVD